MEETFLISFSGGDHPGITSSLAEILSRHGARLLDIGQAVVHEALALGMLVRLAPLAKPEPLERDLRERANALGLRVAFSPVGAEEFAHWADSQAKDRFIVTLLGREVTAAQLASVSAATARHSLNIDRIERLSGRLSMAAPTPDGYACLELHLSTDPGQTPAPATPVPTPAVEPAAAPQHHALRADLLALSRELTLDIAFQRESVFRRNRRLFAFDMDSTLIDGEVIDELAKLAGVGGQVARITAAAMRGELDFQQSFRARVGLLCGLPQEQVQSVLRTIPLVPGAERLISTLKRLGYKTAILSGGFNFFASDLQSRLGIDHVHANDLDIADGLVTGHVTTPIVDAQRKADLLREIAAKENISLDQVVAVGDGANDLPMLAIAGMGIAFRAKPLVREQASHSLSHLGLDSLLYLIGIRDRDLVGMGP